MAEFQLDARPYFQILHNLLRQHEIDYDPEQTALVVEWVRTNSAILRKVTTTAEFGVLMVFYTHWDKHKIAPDRKMMDELIHSKTQPKTLLDTMAEYDNHAEDLEQVPHLNLDMYLDQRKQDYEKYKLAKALDIASQITLSSVQMTDKAKTTYEGPRDAMKYLHERFQTGILIDDVPAQGGVLADTATKIRGRYDQNETDSKNNNLFIPTGIALIDNHLGGLRRKELNGVLGFVGQRKSGVVRTIGYKAARSGFRVLHIPLESDYDEEETVYAVMHAQFYCYGQDHTISKSRVDRAILTPEEKEKFFEEVIPDYQEIVARNITVYSPGVSRDWADVRAIIERENDKEPVDLVIIDYLTMLSTPGNRDDIADKMAIIQDAKRLAMTANEGRGMCIITPVQGNRKGFEDAGENEGAWTTTGIAKYSELDKSLDNLFYVYFDDDMNNQNTMKMGSCKTRRGFNIPSTFVAVETNSGMVLNEEVKDVQPASTGGGAKEPAKDQPMSQEIDKWEDVA